MFKVKAKNQGYIKNADVDFVPGLNVLRGKSSQGKSTLFRAIETTVFNLPSDYLITYGEKKSSVTLEYNGHEIKRDRDLDAKEYKTVYYIDGTKYVKNGKTALEEVQEKIGLKELVISNSKLHIAFSSAFGLPFLVDESPQKIFDFITFSSSSLDISDVVQKIKSDISENKDETKKLEIEINTLKDLFIKQSKKKELFNEYSEINKLSENVKKSNDIYNSISEILNDFSKTEKEIKTLERLPVLDKNNIEYDDFLKLNDVINSLKEKQEEIKKLESLYKKNELIIRTFPSDFNESMFKSKNEDIKKIDTLLSEIKTVITKGNKLRKLNIKFSFDLDKNKQDKLTELDVLLKNIKAIKNEGLKQNLSEINKQLKIVIDELKSFDCCPMCGAKLI